ncbi:MAG: 2-oxoacid:ferredoxin oxidoreductase subunit beta [Anaerolineae bacterium]|nr:2-oxoacid:ferredoxin oxidoreductase subunit beta [Anaerolineae bacterium]
MAEPKTEKRRPNDYKSNVKPIWCPGCGDYAVLASFVRALADMNLPPEQVAIASGIGCSGRFPAFARVYGYHGVHGRPVPLATGIKLGNPELTVFAFGGDGDAFSIGAGHLPHAAIRNVDITYVVLDNEIYGLTKGQPSPTTPTGHRTKASPYGKVGRQANPLMMMLSYGASFVARGNSSDPRTLTDLIIQAVRHPGFAFLQVYSPCVTFFDTYPMVKEKQTPIPDTHDPKDLYSAMRLASDPDHLYMGVFYQDDADDNYLSEMVKVSAKAGQNGYGIADLVGRYQVD